MTEYLPMDDEEILTPEDRGGDDTNLIDQPNVENTRNVSLDITENL